MICVKENGLIEFPEDLYTMDDFNEWFIEVMLHCNTLDEMAKRIGYIITDEAILEGYILPFTEWDSEIIENINAKTLCYWYLLQLLFIYFENEDSIGRWTEDIFSWLQEQILV